MHKELPETVYGTCIIANGVAIATLDTITSNGGHLSASGTARKHPEDKFSADVAENLAYGRALEALGKKLQKRANGKVKNQEDTAERKKRIKQALKKKKIHTAKEGKS